MARALAARDFGCSLASAEQLWYDTERWPAFIDGCERVLRVDGPWPEAGAELEWESTPAGRGRVVERVLSRVPGEGQELASADSRLTGTQRVTFELLDDGVGVQLELDYRLSGSPLRAALLDALFVRRALTDSLQRTLERFGRELDVTR
jgi:uncharacterized membrane protein